MCATAHLRRAPEDLPGLPVAKAPPVVASRTQTLIDRSESLAHGGRAFVEHVKEMAGSGMLDRQKMMDWVRIVSLFNKATGKDTSHGLLDMVHHLLSHMPLTDEERQQQQKGEQHRLYGRSRANATKPPELDELSCYMISRGGNGAETMFCSEAMKQLFISTDELKMTVQETGLTSISVWATFTTPEGLATLNRAASTVFLQKDTEQVEVELECLTRTGLLVACAGTVSFRVLESGESTLILSLTVKQDAPPRALASSSSSSSSSSRTNHAASEKGAGMSLSSRRTSYASERLAALASKREQQKQQQLLQQQEESRRRRPRPRDEAPVPSSSSNSSLCSSASSTSSSSTTTSTSSSSTFSSIPSSRPPPQRTAISFKRRKIPSPVTWSQDGPPLPEALFQRLLTRSKDLSTMAGAWSHDEKEKVFAWTPTPEHLQKLHQQQQQRQQQQQQYVQEYLEREQQGGGKFGRMVVMREDGGEEQQHEWQRPQVPQQQQQQQQQQQRAVAMAPACLLPSALSTLVSLPGMPVFASAGNSNSGSSSSSSGASTEHDEDEEGMEQQQQQQQQHLKREDDEDDIWAWADSIWDGAEGAQPPLDLGTGLGVGVVGVGMEGGMEGGMGAAGGVEDPSLWLMLDQQGL